MTETGKKKNQNTASSGKEDVTKKRPVSGAKKMLEI